tara:strand:+ start:3175 stop:4089 length:915 start_codon:yes stop_codon:yes gene_type:complete
MGAKDFKHYDSDKHPRVAAVHELALRVLSSSENVPSDDAVSTFGWGEVDVHAVAWVSCFCKLPFSEWKAIANDVSYKLQSMVERNQTMLYGGTERGTRIPSGYYQWVDKLLETILQRLLQRRKTVPYLNYFLHWFRPFLSTECTEDVDVIWHLLSVNRTWNKTIYDGYVREALLQTGVEAGSRRRAFAREAMMRSQRLKERAMLQMRHWREGAGRYNMSETLVGPRMRALVELTNSPALPEPRTPTHADKRCRVDAGASKCERYSAQDFLRQLDSTAVILPDPWQKVPLPPSREPTLPKDNAAN